VTTEKDKFLEDQFFSMALMATAQRGNLYLKNASASDKQAFRRRAHEVLRALVEQYAQSVSETQHTENIRSLADLLSREFASVLLPDSSGAGRFRIGSAQKLLNLYLKYLWCWERIPLPPHCCLDSIVLSHLPDYRGKTWTRLESVEEYEEVIKHARAKAGERSLAEWELRLYNAREHISDQSI
jgi:hypothetical protein